jgi:hypothetical protein
MSFRIVLIAGLLATVAAAGACQKVRTKLGIGDMVTSPAPGTPDKVIQDVLAAAANSDEEAGWMSFIRQLHSDETESPAAMSTWRSMKFNTIRRKVELLLVDKSAITFKVMDRRAEGDAITIFVKNSASDVPTPCQLKRDKARNNAWKVANTCF